MKVSTAGMPPCGGQIAAAFEASGGSLPICLSLSLSRSAIYLNSTISLPILRAIIPAMT